MSTENRMGLVDLLKSKLVEKFKLKDKKIVSLGFPLNPLIKNTLFPSNYVEMNNRIVEERIGELQGSVVELHYQTIEEYSSLSSDDRQRVRNFVDRLKKLGFRFMIHFPFLHQKGDGIFNMDFAWLTVPKDHREKPLMQIMANEIFAREVPFETSTGFLRYCDFLGIKNVTIHATKPGTFLEGEDFEDFGQKIEALTTYIEDEQLNVEIAVETGGITLDQLTYLHDKYNTNVNLDTAHIFLDLAAIHPEMSHFKKNEMITDYFRTYRSFISQLHLTQSRNGTDEHRPISENGMIGCNADILKIIQKDFEKGKLYLAMIEAEIQEKDQEFIKEAVTRNYLGHGNSIINIFMGYPASGKSESAKTLQTLIGKTINSDEERIFYGDAMSQKDIVPETCKNKVYAELFDRLEYGIRSGYRELNIQASFSLKTRRDQLYSLLSGSTNEIFIWNFVRSEEDCRKRLDRRKKKKELEESQGNEFPPNILYDYELFTAFMTEEHTVFDEAEIPQALRARMHVVAYDTTKKTVKVTNPSLITKEAINLLTDNAVAKGYGHPKIQYSYFD